MKNIWKNSVFLFICWLLTSCSSALRLNEFDLSNEYQASGLNYELNVSFQSINDSISSALVQIDANDLLFSKTNSGNYIARYSIGYKVFEDYSDKDALDTSKIYFSLTQKKNTQKKLHTINFFAPIGNNYVVKIYLVDENRSHKTSKVKTLRKKYRSDRSYFKIRALNKDVVNFTVYQKDSFSISPPENYENPIQVMIFPYKTTCAAMPYEVTHSLKLESIPDSTWFIYDSGDYKFPPLKNGYYHFITDTSKNEGFSVFSLNSSFPKISSIKNANGALGYLLEKTNYINLLSDNNPKRSFEKEWISLAGNQERARNLIRNYYSEVSNANKLFSSNQPGWSTDRGMIYIIYGVPKIVYRHQNSEVWIYGEENNLLSEEFEFKKIHSTISDEIYELKRNINFKISFSRMVKAWIDERGY